MLIRCLCVATIVAGTLCGPTNDARSAERAARFESRHLVIYVSRSQKSVVAFSDFAGTAAKVAVEGAGDHPLVPSFSDEVACFIAGTKAYAYGARSGKWGVIEVGPGASPTVNQARVEVEAGGKVYLFSSASEKWSVIDPEKD